MQRQAAENMKLIDKIMSSNALYSHYIIDGAALEASPAELLDECMDEHTKMPAERFEDIVDETTEAPLSTEKYDISRTEEYLSRCLTELQGRQPVFDEDDEELGLEERPFKMLIAESFTTGQIAGKIIDTLWSEGHFTMENLAVVMYWQWNMRPVGNMAAFYRSVAAASDYIYDLGINLLGYCVDETEEESTLSIDIMIDEEAGIEKLEAEGVEEFIDKSPVWVGEDRKCPDTFVECKNSRLVYIPFDTAAYKLGGSLLSECYNINSGPGPKNDNPDYFADCYEVVREMVEDGIVMSARTVSEGGLLTAAALMCNETMGIELNIKGIMESYKGCDQTSILFGEVPAVLLQVKSSDMDYFDTQMLLQDVAYYPLGSPSEADKGQIKIDSRRPDGIAAIVSSLFNAALNEDVKEGED